MSVDHSARFPLHARRNQQECALRFITVPATSGLNRSPSRSPDRAMSSCGCCTTGFAGSDLHEYYDGPVTTRTTPHPLTGVAEPRDSRSRAVRRSPVLRRRRRGSGIRRSRGGGSARDLRPLCVVPGWGQYNHCPILAPARLQPQRRRTGGIHRRAALDGAPPARRHDRDAGCAHRTVCPSPGTPQTAAGSKP